MDGRDESGQTLVEGALALPIVLFLLMLLIQATWVIYCSTSLSNAISHMQYSITAEEARGATDANALVSEKIRDGSIVLASGDLSVSGATIIEDSGGYLTEDLPDSDFDQYKLATKNEQTTRLYITAHVEYKPLTLVGGLVDPTIVRDVKANRISEERFELG